ncbi:hypothetical protein FSP39_016246, partial [Pinctada imbricata]
DKDVDQCFAINTEECPWIEAFLKLSKRVTSLEDQLKKYMAKTEAIKTTPKEETYIPSEIHGPMSILIEKLENATKAYSSLENRMESVTSRLFSDELLGLLIFLYVLYELATRLRPFATQWIILAQETMQNRMTKSETITASPPPSPSGEVTEVPVTEEVLEPCGLTPIEEEPVSEPECNEVPHKEEVKPKKEKVSFAMPMIPKHGVLRNEMCVVLFRRQNINIYASVVETLLGYVTDIKIANAPFYVIDNVSDLSKIPHVKLFLLICDCNNDYTNGSSRDLRLATIRVMHRLGAGVIVVIGNDSESTILTGHGQYNNNLRFVFSNEVMQDLASSGRVFSINREMSPHQMSHLRKMVKMIMNCQAQFDQQ